MRRFLPPILPDKTLTPGDTFDVTPAERLYRWQRWVVLTAVRRAIRAGELPRPPVGWRTGLRWVMPPNG